VRSLSSQSTNSTRSVPGHPWRSLTLVLGGRCQQSPARTNNQEVSPGIVTSTVSCWFTVTAFPDVAGSRSKYSSAFYGIIFVTHSSTIACLLSSDLRTSAMAGLEQLEIHSKVCQTCILVAHSLIHTVIHCSLGEGRRRSYNILEHSTA
jgi:hypothetical protein